MQYLKELMIGIKTTVDLKGINQGVAGINAKISSIKTSFKGLGDSIPGLETAGLNIGLGMAVKSASEFQYQMQLAGNTANASAEEIKAMSQDVMDLSAKTNQLPENMQKALGFLIATGMDKNMAKESLESIGKVATATGSDIEDVSKTVAALEQNLKVKPSELNQTMDMLASAGKAGNFELKDMASYLPTLTAGYQSLGATGYKSAASLGAALQVARMGAGDASEAANNTRNFLAKLTAQETVKNFKDMGVNLQAEMKKGLESGDLMGHMVGLIKKVTGGNKFKLNELFGDMQVTNFLNPMMQNFDKYKQIRDEALNSKDVINTDFEKMMGTSKEQIKSLQIEGTKLAMVIGDILIPNVLKLVRNVKPMVNSFADWAKQHPQIIEGLAGIVIGAAGLKIALNLIQIPLFFASAGLKGITGTIAAIDIACKSVKLLTGATIVADLTTGKWHKALKIATALQWLWNASQLANPMVWVVGGIVLGVAAVVAGVALLYNYWDDVKRIAIEVGAAIKDAIGSAIDWVISKIAGIFQAFSDVWNNIKSVFSGGNSLAVNATVDSTKARQSSPQPSFATASNYPMVQAQQKINASIPAVSQVQATKGYNPTVTAAQAQNSKVAIVNAAQAKQPPQVVKQQSQPNNVTMTNNYTINAATNPQAVSAEIDKRNRVARSYLNGGVMA